jgi:hypothetical protein
MRSDKKGYENPAKILQGSASGKLMRVPGRFQIMVMQLAPRRSKFLVASPPTHTPCANTTPPRTADLTGFHSPIPTLVILEFLTSRGIRVASMLRCGLRTRRLILADRIGLLHNSPSLQVRRQLGIPRPPWCAGGTPRWNSDPQFLQLNRFSHSSSLPSVGDTIYALSTAQGRAGIAVIRISGPSCREVLRRPV